MNDPIYHVLCKTLGKHHSMTFLDEVSDSKRILVGISTGKALVCHVKEWVMTLLFDHVTDHSPLLFSGVNAGRIMCASVQQDNRVVGSSF